MMEDLGRLGEHRTVSFMDYNRTSYPRSYPAAPMCYLNTGQFMFPGAPTAGFYPPAPFPPGLGLTAASVRLDAPSHREFTDFDKEQLRETQIRETHIRESQLRESQMRETQLREVQIRDSQIRDKQYRDSQSRESQSESLRPQIVVAEPKDIHGKDTHQLLPQFRDSLLQIKDSRGSPTSDGGLSKDCQEAKKKTQRSPRPDQASPARSPTPSASPQPGQQDSPSPDQARKKYPDYCRTLVVKDANGTTKELVFPKALDLDRPKRARTTFSAEQLYHLEREFNRNQYLVGRERTDLADQLQLSETQVKVWFQNRRTKYKRDKQRETDERSANAESLAACNILRILQPSGPTSSSGPQHGNLGSQSDSMQGQHNPFLPPNLSPTLSGHPAVTTSLSLAKPSPFFTL